MTKNNYYLVSRDREKNTMEFITIPKHNQSGKNLNLEEIDLFTMNFKSEAQLIIYLYDNQYIDKFNVDLFIANRGVKNIDYYEIIYNQDEYLNKLLKEIAEASIEDCISYSKSSNILIDAFCKKMHFSQNFSNLVKFRMTNVYKKFVDYFNDSNTNLNHLFSFKYRDGSWAMKSYPLQRNMVEALLKYEKIKKNNKDIIEASVELYNFNNPSRIKLKQEIMEKTDKNYFEGQLNLFDINFKNEEIISDKALEVLEFIKHLPINVIKLDSKRYIFNRSLFEDCDMELVDYLDQCLSSKLKKIIYLYTLHNNLLEEANRAFSNTNELEDELRKDTASLLKMLRNNEKELDNAYSFIKLYNKCMMDIEMHKGEVDGKIFRKRKDS